MKFSIEDSSTEDEDDFTGQKIIKNKNDNKNKNSGNNKNNKNNVSDMYSAHLPQSQKQQKNDKNKRDSTYENINSNKNNKNGVLGSIFSSNNHSTQNGKIKNIVGKPEYSQVGVDSDDDYERVDRGRERGSERGSGRESVGGCRGGGGGKSSEQRRGKSSGGSGSGGGSSGRKEVEEEEDGGEGEGLNPFHRRR